LQEIFGPIIAKLRPQHNLDLDEPPNREDIDPGASDAYRQPVTGAQARRRLIEHLNNAVADLAEDLGYSPGQVALRMADLVREGLPQVPSEWLAQLFLRTDVEYTWHDREFEVRFRGTTMYFPVAGVVHPADGSSILEVVDLSRVRIGVLGQPLQFGDR